MRNRILSVQDLCAFGSTSMMAAIPIYTRFGHQVLNLPSAILSAHTGYSGYNMLDFTSQWQGYIKHWQKLGLRCNAMHTGFLGSVTQANFLLNNHSKILVDDPLVLIDPVLADDGKLYSCYTLEMVEAMRDLAEMGNIITPNFTEAAFLMHDKYPQDPFSIDLEDWCSELSYLGPEHIIITSAPGKNNSFSKVVYYNGDSEFYQEYDFALSPLTIAGAGDCFAALLLSNILLGMKISDAIPKVCSFLAQAIARVQEEKTDPRYGIDLGYVLNSDLMKIF